MDAHMEPDRVLGIEELNEHYFGLQNENKRGTFNPLIDVKARRFCCVITK